MLLHRAACGVWPVVHTMKTTSVACLGALLGSARAAADAGRPPPSPPAIEFDSTLDDYAVLQMQPSVA